VSAWVGKDSFACALAGEGFMNPKESSRVNMIREVSAFLVKGVLCMRNKIFSGIEENIIKDFRGYLKMRKPVIS
jgi:hypothetical protein